jgi:hypothetical protein
MEVESPQLREGICGEGEDLQRTARWPLRLALDMPKMTYKPFDKLACHATFMVTLHHK